MSSARPAVPTGWQRTTVDQVFDHRLGKMLDAAKNTGQLRPYLRNANVRWFGFDLSDLKEMRVEEDELSEVSIRKGDLVVCEGGEPGRAAVWTSPNETVVIQKACHRLRPADGVLPHFYAYLLAAEAWSGRLDAAFTGSTIKHLTGAKLRCYAIPLPPTPEQRRIVAEIEKHLTRLDEAVATLEGVRAKLKQARASVLKAAVEGRLVPTEAELARAEGRSYEPASVLLQRILEERRRRWPAGKKYQAPGAPDAADLPSLPEGWVWTALDGLLLEIEAGKSFACDERPPAPNEVGVVKVSAVTWGTYDETETKTCRDRSKVRAGYFIRPGDFLFSRANTIELVGACVVVESTSLNVMLSDKILRLVHAMPHCQRWVLHVLRSRHGRRQIESLATGNQESMRNIGQSRIRRIAVPLPPLAEQTRIVAEAERRLSVVDALDKTVEENLARCGRLRQSVLKRAFEGKLVPQDPRDEPASELLARIRAGRVAKVTP